MQNAHDLYRLAEMSIKPQFSKTQRRASTQTRPTARVRNSRGDGNDINPIAHVAVLGEN